MPSNRDTDTFKIISDNVRTKSDNITVQLLPVIVINKMKGEVS